MFFIILLIYIFNVEFIILGVRIQHSVPQIPDNCSEAREGRSGVMEGDRTLPGVAFVAASGRAFFV